MNCSDFQKMIPDIIDKNIDDKELAPILEHIESCKECYDELEIYYVLRCGLDDDSGKPMNFIGQLENSISSMKKRSERYTAARSVYVFTQLAAYAAIAGAFIYVLFKYFIG
ncbi:MAG: zf-HC2 domain-containing protein [Butyrivibrio sp.]|nr:zf-HC2 domain-containing protein [Butyrivibrio sp.]